LTLLNNSKTAEKEKDPVILKMNLEVVPLDFLRNPKIVLLVLDLMEIALEKSLLHTLNKFIEKENDSLYVY